jgi:hypothetical protein
MDQFKKSLNVLTEIIFQCPRQVTKIVPKKISVGHPDIPRSAGNIQKWR